MANQINYVHVFDNALRQKYSRELCTAPLTTENVTFTGAQQISVPYMTLSGYRDHNRQGGFNRASASTGSQYMSLYFDRDVEFFVDSMDVDESNQIIAATNLTNVFESEYAIPEVDAFRISQLIQQMESFDRAHDSTELSVDNVLEVYDDYMERMDDAEVPQEGRLLFITPQVNNMLKRAVEINHALIYTDPSQAVNRVIRHLDDVQVIVVPSNRMKSNYSFTNGFSPAANAIQINMILVHPKSVIAVNKHSYIKLWPPGTHTQGDGYLYQNRQYSGLFLIEKRLNGLRINAG
ncbi:MAG: capsid protein [Clostridiales bacterium]|jgi:hypothetical protein|nr:capsid protein [Clostridiales bacterium]